MYIIEEGTVIKKGKRKGVISALLLGTLIGAVDGAPMGAPEVGLYWARVKVPSFPDPLLVRSQYNFQVGAVVRIKYETPEPGYQPSNAELVIDWE